jgi:hypothetical protein
MNGDNFESTVLAALAALVLMTLIVCITIYNCLPH